MFDFSVAVERALTMPAAAVVSGLLGLVLGAGAWMIKDRTSLLRTAAAGSVFWAVHFLLMGAITAGWLNVFIAIRTFVSSRVSSRRGRVVLFTVASTVFCIVAFLTWQGPVSAIPLVATIVSTWSYAFLSNQRMRYATFPASALWMVNSVIWGSWPNLAAEALRSAMTGIGLWRLRGGR